MLNIVCDWFQATVAGLRTDTTTDTVGFTKPRYLLSGPLWKNFTDPCLRPFSHQPLIVALDSVYIVVASVFIL